MEDYAGKTRMVREIYLYSTGRISQIINARLPQKLISENQENLNGDAQSIFTQNSEHIIGVYQHLTPVKDDEKNKELYREMETKMIDTIQYHAFSWHGIFEHADPFLIQIICNKKGIWFLADKSKLWNPLQRITLSDFTSFPKFYRKKAENVDSLLIKYQENVGVEPELQTFEMQISTWKKLQKERDQIRDELLQYGLTFQEWWVLNSLELTEERGKMDGKFN